MSQTGVCILLATQDVLCGYIVMEMLNLCSYEEVYNGESPLDALTAVCEAKTRLRIVLTNMNRINAQVARDILYHIQQKLHLRTFFMSPNAHRFDLSGQANNGGFVVYIINSFNENSLPMFWKTSFVSSDEVSKAIAMTSQIIDFWNPNEGTSGASASASASSAMPEEGANVDAAGKKDRIIWTDEWERLFLKAIHSQDPKKITAGEIVNLMNVPELNRKNVGSHLQKYRLRIGKKEDEASSTPRPQRRPTYVGLRLTNNERSIKAGTSTYTVLFPPAPLENPQPIASEPVRDQQPEIPLVLDDHSGESSQVNKATTTEPIQDQQPVMPSVNDAQPSSQATLRESEDDEEFLQMMLQNFFDDRPPSPLN